MECRICHQPINFVRGSFPGRRRKTSIAVHEGEALRVLEQIRGEVVIPHPGTQRRLRLELEERHRLEKSPVDTMQEMREMEEGVFPLDQSDNNLVPLDSRS
jgi:hypothetical protein